MSGGRLVALLALILAVGVSATAGGADAKSR
jgi:hypothetical protein